MSRGRCKAGIALLLASLTGGAAVAQAGAVPVYCEAGAEAGSKAALSCFRADTRGELASVPAGHFLHLTDVLVGGSDPAAAGGFDVVVGRDEGEPIPARQVVLSGAARPLARRHTSLPAIVLAAGEVLAAANLASSDFAVDVRVAGFLSETVAVPEPEATAGFVAAGVALAGLGWRRAPRHASR